MSKIESLTPEQESQLSVYRDKWLTIGLATGPVDFEKAKEAVCLAYRLAGLDEPVNFYKAKSPLDAVRLIQSLDPSLSSSDIVSSMTYGCHDANWLGFYKYFRDVVGIEDCHKLDGLIELANHCGWLNMYDDTVVFQDRPEIIKFDDQNRLHCEDGHAIRFSDGYSVYSWHGTRVPKDWIENKGTLSPETALTWDNVEQRRAACEILGWATVLRKLDAQVIDCDDDPQIGILVEVNIPDIGKERFIKVLCGTGREFAIPVPPNMKTALEANAWTYGLDGDVLKQLEIRT
jgi:hypothetical protein